MTLLELYSLRSTMIVLPLRVLCPKMFVRETFWNRILRGTHFWAKEVPCIEISDITEQCAVVHVAPKNITMGCPNLVQIKT